MEHFSDWYFSLIFFTGILGCVVAAILFFVNKSDTFSSKLLAGFLFCISLMVMNYTLMTTRFFLSYPHLWRVVGWASFSFPPLAYLYVRSVLEQSFSLKRTDIFLFSPAILHLVHMSPFYFLPAGEKIIFLNQVAVEPRLIITEPEGLMPEGWVSRARLTVGMGSIIAQTIFVHKWKKSFHRHGQKDGNNIETFRWLSLFTTLMAIFWAAIFMAIVFNFYDRTNLNYVIIFTFSSVIFFVSIYLLLKPSILYGIKGWLHNNDAENGEIAITALQHNNSYKRNLLTPDEGKSYKELLEKHFAHSMPYLKKGYTIRQLAIELDIPSHQLSAFINQEYGKNFNELINEYRVRYLQDLLSRSPENFQYTFEALSQLAGFNSRTTFIAAVKKITGKTPTAFFGKKDDIDYAIS